MTEQDNQAASEGQQTDGKPEVPTMALHLTNLVLLVATGVWISLWFHHYTEWFPVIGGILGLGSFFAWGAFVTGLLTDARKERYQQCFDEKVLSSRRFVFFILLANLAFIALAPAGYGGLRIINASPSESLSVSVLPAVTEPIFIGPQQQMKLALPTPRLCETLLFCEQNYTLQSSDAPALSVELQAFTRRTLILPGAAWRQPLALIRPATEADYRAFARTNTKYYLRIGICEGDAPEDCSIVHDGFSDGKEDYEGSAFIVGTLEDVLLPDDLMQRWRSQGWPSDIVSRWSRPLKPRQPRLLQGEGRRVAAELLGPDGNVVCAASHTFTGETPDLVEIEIGASSC